MMGAATYDALLSAIAAHGVAVVAVDRKFEMKTKINYTALASSLDPVFSYIESPGGLRRDCAAIEVGEEEGGGGGGHGASCSALRTDVILAGGHSAGNHLMVRRLTSFGCGAIGGVVMVDPVDGEDPYGFVKQYVIHPPALVNFDVPALHVRCGLDPAKASFISPPCAPAYMSNDRFYNAWRGPIWEMNATAFGHMDLTTMTEEPMARLVCPGNKNATARQHYVETVSGAVAAFATNLMDGRVNLADIILSGGGGNGSSVFPPPPVAATYSKSLKSRPLGTITPTCRHL
eukprot:g4769.t1